MPKTANAYLKIIVVSDMKKAVNDFTSAHPKIAAFGRGVAKAGLIAGAAIGALVATFYVLKKALTVTLGAYVEYGKKLIGLTRISGITGRAVQNLSAQFQMSGVDATKAQTAMGLFAKSLDKARQGYVKGADAIATLDEKSKTYSEDLAKMEDKLKSAQGPFARLGVKVVDAKGKFRDTGDVLADVRDRLSETDDAATRAGIAAALFGRGFQTLGAWLTKSKKDIAGFNRIVKESGVTWGGKNVNDMKDFIKAQREMTLRWDLMKVAIGQKLMPTAVTFMKRMSAWFGDKANQQMIKDFATDIGEIAAALVKVTGQVAKANSFFERFGSAKKYIEAFMNPLGSMSRRMVEVALSADKVWAAIRKIIAAVGDIKIGPFGDLSGAVKRLLGPLGSALSAIDSILRKLGLIKDTGPIFVPVKVKFTTIGSVDWPSTMGQGDASEGIANTSGAGYGWASRLAQQFGNVVTSTYRPGAITASGNVSDHGTYGRAADLADGLGNMARLWNYVKSTAGSWKQAIYQHQMINYGKLGYYGPGDHFDHVHLARRSFGGVVKRPEVSLIGESGPEAIIPLTKPRRARQVMQEAGLAGPGGGTVTYNVNVVVPGGTTLIGTAREVGDILAPHIGRALGRAYDRAERRR